MSAAACTRIVRLPHLTPSIRWAMCRQAAAAQRSGMRGVQDTAAQLVAYRQMVERRLQHESEVDEEAADIAEMVAAEQAEAEAAKRAPTA